MAVFKMEKNGKITWASKFRYETWNGEIKQKKKEGFATRREALVWEKTFLGTCKTDVTMTFETLVGKYMADCEARLEPTSVMHKEYIINSFIMVEKHGSGKVYSSRLSNGPIESINRKVKDLKRLGRGFRNFEHFRNRFLYATRQSLYFFTQSI